MRPAKAQKSKPIPTHGSTDPKNLSPNGIVKFLLKNGGRSSKSPAKIDAIPSPKPRKKSPPKEAPLQFFGVLCGGSRCPQFLN